MLMQSSLVFADENAIIEFMKKSEIRNMIARQPSNYAVEYQCNQACFKKCNVDLTSGFIYTAMWADKIDGKEQSKATATYSAVSPWKCPKYFSRYQYGLHVWEIVGITLGCVAFVVILIVMIVCIVRRGRGPGGKTIRMRVW